MDQSEYTTWRVDWYLRIIDRGAGAEGSWMPGVLGRIHELVFAENAERAIYAGHDPGPFDPRHEP